MLGLHQLTYCAIRVNHIIALLLVFPICKAEGNTIPIAQLQSRDKFSYLESTLITFKSQKCWVQLGKHWISPWRAKKGKGLHEDCVETHKYGFQPHRLEEEYWRRNEGRCRTCQLPLRQMRLSQCQELSPESHLLGQCCHQMSHNTLWQEDPC